MGTLKLILLVVAACILLPLAVLFLLPLILAQFTVWRGRYKDKNYQSSLFVGRVWHTRHLPTHHAFCYPLFIFAVDLEKIEDELFDDKLWPLSIIMNLRTSDHLKNGEGLIIQADDNDKLRERIYRLVAEKTENRFQPTSETHRILLATHLCYYGYCFNPVSFYYLLNRTTGKTDAVVAEVSNTPWNEMYCYVLHPQSLQVKTVTSTRNGINYVFPKAFHVSPFMEMDYNYDWIFDDRLHDSIRVVTAMKRGDTPQFSATMHVHRKGLHPYRLAWQLASYPIYCMIIQIWIHYEAFWLFYKGVSFQPHPEGAETTASRVIGNLMKPFFAVQAWIEERQSKKNA